MTDTENKERIALAYYKAVGAFLDDVKNNPDLVKRVTAWLANESATITPEMIEAGKEALAKGMGEAVSFDEVARRIFTAMIRAGEESGA